MQQQRGQLHQAAYSFRQAIAERNAPGMGMAHLALGELFYEWNQLDAAAQHFQQGLRISNQRQVYTTQVAGYRWWARLKQVLGQTELANEAMRTAHDIVDMQQLSEHLRVQNFEWELWLAVMRQDLAGIEHWLNYLAIPDLFHPVRSLFYSRALIALDQMSEAYDFLKMWLPTAVQHGYRTAVITILLQQAITRIPAPHPLVIDAITFAQKENFRRTFIDQGPTVLALLPAAMEHPETAAYADKLINTAHYVPDEETAVFNKITQLASTPTHAQPALTGEQMQLLKHVLDGKSYDDIAKMLGISYQAVKEQIADLNAKLGILNHTEQSS